VLGEKHGELMAAIELATGKALVRHRFPHVSRAEEALSRGSVHRPCQAWSAEPGIALHELR
jgi:hypothetical protein